MNKKKFKQLVKTVVKDESLIPSDTPYCYTIDQERLAEQGGKTFELGLPINICPYYVWGKGNRRGCTFVEYYDSDLLLWDQCKICGINEGWDRSEKSPDSN